MRGVAWNALDASAYAYYLNTLIIAQRAELYACAGNRVYNQGEIGFESTLHISEKTNGTVLPQLCPLEVTSADTSQAGTKRDVAYKAGVQHSRGDTASIAELQGASLGRRTSPPQEKPARVFVLDKKHNPLMPCSPATARRLLKGKRAVVHTRIPFTIRIKDRIAEDSNMQEVSVGIDPGANITGVSLYKETATGRVELWAGQIVHRRQKISMQLRKRKIYRKSRRGRNLRYRAARFSNRKNRVGKIAPSLQHLVDSTTNVVAKLKARVPLTHIRVETVLFDTQKVLNPAIKGNEYQQGELFSTDVKAYVRAKFSNACAYCKTTTGKLEIEHVIPKAKGGTDRISNLVLACRTCNQAKGTKTLEEFVKDPSVRAAIKGQLTRSLKAASAVNTSRKALIVSLQKVVASVEEYNGFATSRIRKENSIDKTHSLDALCVGDNVVVRSTVDRVLKVHVYGRGQYRRTAPDKFGFPLRHYARHRTFRGFTRADLVLCFCKRGTRPGYSTGRIHGFRKKDFNYTDQNGDVRSGSYKTSRVLQRNDGYHYVAVSRIEEKDEAAETLRKYAEKASAL